MERPEIKIDKIKGNNFFYKFTKRLFDIVFASLFIIVFSWLLLLVLIINTIATKGHPIYKDERVGYKGKVFHLYKFRTMVYDADNIDKYFTQEQKEYWEREKKVENDPRITKFGKVLRESSADELLQIFNILFGTMAVIGWRPISKSETKNYYARELDVLYAGKPGLTGYWQVRARNNADFASGQRQQLELEYYSKRSLLLDAWILIMTIPTVLSKKGAR